MPHRIVLLHGWKVRDFGRSTVGVLREPFEDLGHEVMMPSYGYTFTPTVTRLRSRKAAKLLSVNLERGDVVVGHSNGARVAWELSFYAPCVTTMVWINPALDVDVVPARTVRRCLVLHNPGDFVTRIARLIPGSIWGSMGRVGYRPASGSPWGPDRRMHNRSMGKGHTPFRSDPARWARMISVFAESGG
jgi:pimeloyl-ACP methyl ester carboxylesterase